MLIVENMFTFAILRNAPKQTSEQASIQFVQLVFFVGNFPIELLMRLVFGIPAPHSRHTNGRASVYTVQTHAHHSPYPKGAERK